MSMMGIIGADKVASAAAFDPLTTSPVAWYDFSDPSSLFQNSDGTGAVSADTDPVGYVTDKTGNGRHLIQATSSKRPQYRTGSPRAYLKNDGVDDFMESTGSNFTGFTNPNPAGYIIGVIRSPNANWNNFGSIFDMTNGNGRMGSIVNSGNTGLYTGPSPSASRQNGTSVTVGASCWSSITTRFLFDITGTTITGTYCSTADTRQVFTYDTNVGGACAMELSELFYFDTAPSSTNREKLEGYLAWRHGMNASLPGAHPYFGAPP